MNKKISIEIIKNFVFNKDVVLTKDDFETILNDDNLTNEPYSMINIKNDDIKKLNLTKLNSSNIDCYVNENDYETFELIELLTNLLYFYDNKQCAGYEYFSMIVEALKLKYYYLDDDNLDKDEDEVNALDFEIEED